MTEDDWKIKAEKASNPDSSEEQLLDLSQNYDWRVRAAVASNQKFIKTHANIARILLKDENKIVRANTAKSLGREEKIKEILEEYPNFIE